VRRTCTSSALPRRRAYARGAARRHFENAAALARHLKTKAYKKQCVSRRACPGLVPLLTPSPARLRLLTHGPAPHVQADAEQAAGCGRPDNGPRLRGGDAMG